MVVEMKKVKSECPICGEEVEKGITPTSEIIMCECIIKDGWFLYRLRDPLEKEEDDEV